MRTMARVSVRADGHFAPWHGRCCVEDFEGPSVRAGARAMIHLVYALDTLAMVRAVVVGLAGLGVPDTDIHVAAPVAAAIDAEATPALSELLAPENDASLAPYQGEVAAGRCVLAIDVPDAQLPNVELLFAAFRDDVHRLSLPSSPTLPLPTAA